VFQSNVLGFSYFGNQNRKYKFSIEKFWKRELSEKQLGDAFAEIRKENWFLQKQYQVNLISSNDFSFYDRVLDHVCLFGCLPERFENLRKEQTQQELIELKTYYAMAKGDLSKDIPAMEMTKWFDTNYHYIVPELSENQGFKISSSKVFDEFEEAKALGIKTKPCLIGPVSFLILSKKAKESDPSCLRLLENLVRTYAQVLEKLSSLGAEVIQIEEPCLILDLNQEQKEAYSKFQGLLKRYLSPDFNSKIILTTYFEELSEENLELIFEEKAPEKILWDILHIDLINSENQEQYLKSVLKKIKNTDKKLSLGLINGRNIWINDLEKTIKFLKQNDLNSEQIILGTSCSLLHVPLDLELEKNLQSELKASIAFSKQKLQELKLIRDSLNKELSQADLDLISQNSRAVENRKKSALIHREQVKLRLEKITEDDKKRNSTFEIRREIQKKVLGLPIFPTTTIGSFPQTREIRQSRAKYRKKEISEQEYDQFIKQEIREAIKYQEEAGIDVLVHGEFERNDMVEYFGQYLSGFTTTQSGWVQSYGTRGVKPPIIYGDVERISNMTLDYTQYAQSLTRKNVKGMLTGPVTILQWSFVRDDQPRSKTASQIALAILDEVKDLEKAGIKIIQIDEPAYREGLPLKNSKKPKYLKWATEAFLLSSCRVKDETQIHTHMCYSEFNDIIEDIAKLGADVITIEASRSNMELLRAFENFEYKNQIGPGFYDVHSEIVPKKEDIKTQARKSYKVLPKENIWFNPDCGLKTRKWEESKKALKNLVEAAIELREEVTVGA